MNTDPTLLLWTFIIATSVALVVFLVIFGRNPRHPRPRRTR